MSPAERRRTILAMPVVGQSARFGVVGAFAVALDALVLALTGAAGMSPYLGRVISLSLMLTSTWWLNRTVTFRTAAPPSWREFRDYCLTMMIGAATNYSVYAAILYTTGNKWLGLIIGSLAGAGVNFVRLRRLLDRG